MKCLIQRLPAIPEVQTSLNSEEVEILELENPEIYCEIEPLEEDNCSKDATDSTGVSSSGIYDEVLNLWVWLNYGVPGCIMLAAIETRANSRPQRQNNLSYLIENCLRIKNADFLLLFFT